MIFIDLIGFTDSGAESKARLMLPHRWGARMSARLMSPHHCRTRTLARLMPPHRGVARTPARLVTLVLVDDLKAVVIVKHKKSRLPVTATFELNRGLVL